MISQNLRFELKDLEHKQTFEPKKMPSDIDNFFYNHSIILLIFFLGIWKVGEILGNIIIYFFIKIYERYRK